MARRGKIKLDLTLSKVRSSLTNGRYLLADCDHRSSWARRLRDLVSGHYADMGNADNISQAEQVLVRRAAMLTLQLEMMEAKWAASNDGEATLKQLETYQRASNSLHRLLSGLGLQRRPKNVTPPSLQEYLRSKQARSADIEDAEVIQ